MAFLLADSGSTKTHWVLVENGHILNEFNGDGMNAYVYSADQITKTIQKAKKNFIDENVALDLFFYGAGCSTQVNKKRMLNLFELNGFSGKRVFIEHDLLAAARALFKRKEGIACILGTGSSSCHIKDGYIQDRLPSLGYVIGDEGSGFDLGGRLLRGVLKGHAPKEVIDLFKQEYKMGTDEIISAIYSSAKPNKFVASFTPFLNKYIESDYCTDIVTQAFDSFIAIDINNYKTGLPIGFIGTVAYVFRDILKEVIERNNLMLGDIYKSPMKGLIEFHLEN